jgi:hypothetical protein
MIIRNNLTGTYPSVIHAPDTTKLWDQINENFFSSRIPIAKVYKNLTIITWNNFKSSPLESCLLKKQIPFLALGKDLTIWNNLQKFKLNLEAFNLQTTPYYMGLDAHDVLLLGEIDYIVEKFESLNCDLLFNSESFFYPDFPINYYQNNKFFQQSKSNSKYRYLNSGAWIGRRDFCMKFFAECQKIRIWEMFDCSQYLKLFNCDQSVVHSMFQKYYPKVKLDYNCEVFFNIANISEHELSFHNKIL